MKRTADSKPLFESGTSSGNSRLLIHSDAAFLRELVPDGSTLMVGGFGEPGTPFYLLDRLSASQPRNLTVIKNDANEPGVGVGQLLRVGALSGLIASHIGLNPEMVEAMNRGDVSVEFNPQGILAERIRCGGVGIAAFLSDIGVGLLGEGEEDAVHRREEVEWRGRRYRLEPGIRSDVALLHAHKADRYGNLAFRKSARNFSPLMAMAAHTVVVEVEEIVDEALDPESVHTPGSFVDHLVAVPAHFQPNTKAAALKAESLQARSMADAELIERGQDER